MWLTWSHYKYVLYLLLLGGKDGIEENIETKEPIEFYTNILKEQDMVIKSTFYEKLKGIERVWIEIDSEKTNINESYQKNFDF